MTVLAWIILFCLIGGVLSVIAAAGFLLLPDDTRKGVLPHLVSFAIGTLLGAAFLALLPHALLAESVEDPHIIFAVVLIGVLGFFLLEKLVLWRHYHSLHHEDEKFDVDVAKEKVPGIMVLVGDTLHNLMDGVLIAAAFLTDIRLGVVTAIAVAAHEIPQEVGDFVLLLNSGFSRGRAFLYNVISSAATVVGGVAAYLSLESTEKVLPYALAIAASSFIYIAIADLLPGLHKRPQLRVTLQQIGLIALGIGVIAAAHSNLH